MKKQTEKKRFQKLILHRETIRQLDSQSLEDVHGGVLAPPMTCGDAPSGCPSCDTYHQ